MYAGIYIKKKFVHVECYFTLAGGAGYFYIESDRKNTLAGVDEKFEHTLFNFVQMSTNLTCKVLTVWFSIYIIKTLLYQFELISNFLKFFLSQLII